jgi:hypothetical protein
VESGTLEVTVTEEKSRELLTKVKVRGHDIVRILIPTKMIQ